MLLVVIIIGVTAALAVPRYSRSFAFMKLRSAAYDVAATVEHAQALAVLEERRVLLNVSGSRTSCWLSSESGGDDRPFKPVTCDLPEGITIDSITFDDSLLAHKDYVTFRPDGEPDRCAITLVNRAREAFQVYVEPGLGHTRVVRMEGKT